MPEQNEHAYGNLGTVVLDNDTTAQAERLRPLADDLLELDMRVLTRVVERLPKRERYAILDAGCANGHVARSRIPRLDIPFHCLGVDRCAEAVAQARKQNKDSRFLYSCAEIDELDMEDYGQFDIIFASRTLQSAPDPAKATQRLWDMLAPGGALIAHALDDDTHAVRPSGSNLELLLRSTAALARGSDRHHARELQSRMLRLKPTPSDLLMEFKVDHTAGLDSEERKRFFENAFISRNGSPRQRRDDLADDADTFFALAHSVAVAFK
ncbi:class I SAM-dependent methyltransferase [Paucidesulfovibrio longus]|uniref:class I SAM-dependent methyltransferase n=1 Tax=Paucidesulfovibrio longus TaxID=889 RepID=UPI0003B66FD2|nr:class I SAM-dependent methyltransferase [Paucidesulfovibrio longus]